MDLDDRGRGELRRRRAVVDKCRRTRDRAERSLQRAGREALDALQKAGFSSLSAWGPPIFW